MTPFVGVLRFVCVLVPLLASWLWPAREALAQEPTTAEVLSRLTQAPTVEEVQRAALRQARLQPGRLEALLRRVRWAALLPRVEAQVGRGRSRDEGLNRVFEQPDKIRWSADNKVELRVSLRWELSRLLYDAEELRLLRDTWHQGEQRRELLLAVTRLYYEWVLLRAQLLLTNHDNLEHWSRIAELQGYLDGLTGGLFGEADRTFRPGPEASVPTRRRRTKVPSSP
jgi:hypothetical protein